jgi:hypothetical protein
LHEPGFTRYYSTTQVLQIKLRTDCQKAQWSNSHLPPSPEIMKVKKIIRVRRLPARSSKLRASKTKPPSGLKTARRALHSARRADLSLEVHLRAGWQIQVTEVNS